MDWDKYAPYFSKKEFDCKHTGKNLMRPEFVDIILQIRKTYNKPMIITSGYRDPSHPAEAEKSVSGTHSYGVACDIAVRGEDCMDLLVIAYGYGIRRIGLQQKGANRFMHLDMGDRGLGFPPSIWTY